MPNSYLDYLINPDANTPVTPLGPAGAAPATPKPAMQDDPNRVKLTDQLLQSLARQNTYGDENKLQDEQTARAWALRNAPMPEGRSHGQVYVASSPLEAFAAGLQKVKGQDQLDQSVKQQWARLGQHQGDYAQTAPSVFQGQQDQNSALRALIPFLFGQSPGATPTGAGPQGNPAQQPPTT